MYNNEFEKDTPWDDLHEECGVFGMYDFDGGDVASTIYYGLFALQHRGQESCGIAVSETDGPKGKVTSHKGMGLVNEVFAQDNLEPMKGDIVYRKSLYKHSDKLSHIILDIIQEVVRESVLRCLVQFC